MLPLRKILLSFVEDCVEGIPKDERAQVRRIFRGLPHTVDRDYLIAANDVESALIRGAVSYTH